MDTLKLSYKIFFLTLLGVASGYLLFAGRQYSNNRVSSAAASISVTPTPFIPPDVQSQTMDSPDGTKTLIMKSQAGEDQATYSIFTSEKDGAYNLLVFNQVGNPDSKLEIPYNTWSPDNVYFFLKETSPGLTDYLIFFASGESFPEDQKYLRIQELFLAEYPNFVVEDVTGWAAVNLLLVNVKSDEGEQISFWFDVTSQGFIRLSTYFR